MTYSFAFRSNSSYSFTHIVDGTSYRIHVVYDTYTDSYYIDIDKLVNGAFSRLIQGIRVTTGINLLLQYSYLNLGGIWVIPLTDDVFSEIPSAGTIVDRFVFVWEHD